MLTRNKSVHLLKKLLVNSIDKKYYKKNFYYLEQIKDYISNFSMGSTPL